jgi:hypothetical protein
MSFTQYLTTEFTKNYDNDKMFTFFMKNFQKKGDTDFESIVALFVDNIDDLVDDNILNEIVRQACGMYGIVIDDTELFTSQEIIHSYFDIRNEFGGKNILSSDIGQTVENFRTEFLDESILSLNDINNLNNLFSVITEGTKTTDDVLAILYSSEKDSSLSNNYLAFVNSVIKTFESYPASKKQLSSYFDITRAALDLISIPTDGSGGNGDSVKSIKIRFWIEISDKGVSAGCEASVE